MSVYTWTYIHELIYLNLYTWTYMHGLIYMSVYTWTYIHELIYMNLYSWTYIHELIYMNLYTWTYIHGLIHMTLYTWAYIHELIFMLRIFVFNYSKLWVNIFFMICICYIIFESVIHIKFMYFKEDTFICLIYKTNKENTTIYL